MKTFLKIDYFVQTIWLICMAITLPFIFIPLLLLLGFGGWQLLSGLITACFFPSLDRKGYLVKSIGYLLTLSLFYYLVEAGLFPDFLGDGTILFFLFGVFIPLGIGIWYYRMVYKDYYQYCKKEVNMVDVMRMNQPMEG